MLHACLYTKVFVLCMWWNQTLSLHGTTCAQETRASVCTAWQLCLHFMHSYGYVSLLSCPAQVGQRHSCADWLSPSQLSSGVWSYGLERNTQGCEAKLSGTELYKPRDPIKEHAPWLHIVPQAFPSMWVLVPHVSFRVLQNTGSLTVGHKKYKEFTCWQLKGVFLLLLWL